MQKILLGTFLLMTQATTALALPEVDLWMQGRITSRAGTSCYAHPADGNVPYLRIRFNGSDDTVDLLFKSVGPLHSGDTLVEETTKGNFRYTIVEGNWGEITGITQDPNTGNQINLRISGVSPRLSTIDSFSATVDHRRDSFDSDNIRGPYSCGFN